MTKKFINYLTISTALAGVLSLSAVSAANAAPVSGYNWTGYYAGLRVGLATGDTHWSDIVVPSDTDQNLDGRFANNQPKGGLIGLQTGYNHQFDQFVLGLEGDVNFTTANGAESCIGGYGDYSANCKTDIDVTAHITARVGFTPVDRVLVYAKGGGAFAHSRFRPAGEVGPYDQTTGYASVKRDDIGYVAGGGVEVAVGAKWTVGVEYTYEDYGVSNSQFNPAGEQNDYNPPFTANTTLGFHTAVVKVNYRF